MTVPLSFVSVGDVTSWEQTWDALVAAAPEGWCWHTREWRAFVHAATRDTTAVDPSFFAIAASGRVVGLCPLFVADAAYGDRTIREAGYLGGGLPWPCIDPDVPDRHALLMSTVAEAERRAQAEKAALIRFNASAPAAVADPGWFTRALVEGRYLDVSFPSHLVTVGPDTLPNVRKKYRQYVRKYAADVSTSVLSGADVTPEVEEAYFELHTRDAGGQHRSRASYARAADLARNGLGFFVLAHLRATGQPVGALLIAVSKDGAFDASVGVDPGHEERCVSHLMKWAAIEHLAVLGISHYELGGIAGAATWTRTTSEKSRGISWFKDGWARGGAKTVLVAEKALSREGLRQLVGVKERTLAALWFSDASQ